MRKTSKKTSPRAKKSAAKKTSQEKPVGEITHFYDKISVAIAKFKTTVKKGQKIWIKGAHTDFKQIIGSMQYEHESIDVAKPGLQVGIKVGKLAREGDKIYKAK